MQTCPGFFLKSLLESPGNLLEICSVKFVDTLISSDTFAVRCFIVVVVVAHHIIWYHVVRLSELVLNEVDKICCFG